MLQNCNTYCSSTYTSLRCELISWYGSFFRTSLASVRNASGGSGDYVYVNPPKVKLICNLGATKYLAIICLKKRDITFLLSVDVIISRRHHDKFRIYTYLLDRLYLVLLLKLLPFITIYLIRKGNYVYLTPIYLQYQRSLNILGRTPFLGRTNCSGSKQSHPRRNW